jgi:hypothetical protein
MIPVPGDETIARRPSAELSYRLVAWSIATPCAIGRRVLRGPRVPDLAPLAGKAVALGLAPVMFTALLGWRVQAACLRLALNGAQRVLPLKR